MEGVGLYQIILGAITLIAALNVVLAKNPVVSAMSLMATLFSTGALYFGLGFFFIGAVQILIYAGAVSVLFVFIVMLLDLRPALIKIPGSTPKVLLMGLGGLLLGLACLWPLFSAGTFSTAQTTELVEASASGHAVALRFLTKYMLPFQITGLLIFAAVIGAILVGKPHHSHTSKVRGPLA